MGYVDPLGLAKLGGKYCIADGACWPQVMPGGGGFASKGTKAKSCPINGNSQRPNGVPKDWLQTPGKKEGHTKWVNPKNNHDYVRVKADGTVTQVRNGKAYDRNGNQVTTKSPEAHNIKPKDFIFRP